MRDRLRGAGVVAGCLAVLSLVTAGCSPSDDDTTLPDRTPSTTPATTDATPTPTPTDPTGALETEITAFFEDYIATVNASWTSEEALARRRTMFADSCTDCLAGYNYAHDANELGLRLDAGPLKVHEIRVIGREGDRANFTVVEDSPGGILHAPDGSVVRSFDQYEDLNLSVQAIPDGRGGWLIVESQVLR